MKEYQFYIVPTPIGNMQDMTFRAVEVLKNVDVIACEDSRITQKLLYHYDRFYRLCRNIGVIALQGTVRFSYSLDGIL